MNQGRLARHQAMKTPIQILCDRLAFLIANLKDLPETSRISEAIRNIELRKWSDLFFEGIRVLNDLGANIQEGEIWAPELVRRLGKVKGIIEESEARRKEIQVTFSEIGSKLWAVFWAIVDPESVSEEDKRKLADLFLELNESDLVPLFERTGVPRPRNPVTVSDHLKKVWPAYEDLVARRLQKAASGEDVE